MKQNKDLPKAILYARFSSNQQREESIDAQIRIINEKFRNVYNIVHSYTDSAQSAMTDDREDFQNMMNDVKKGNPYKATVLLDAKRDRLSRNRYDMALTKRELAKAGIRIVSATEHLDDSPESVILESVLDGMSEYYSLNLGREALKGLKENAYTARCTGSIAPLGLKVNKETLKYEIDEENAEAIRILFNRFVYDRWSYQQIADELNAKGYKTARGNSWSNKSSMIDLLENEKMVGRLTYLKSRTNPITRKRTSKRNYNRDEIIVTENAIPAIIDEETFNKAQELLAERKRYCGSFKARETNIFMGKIFCGECGSMMSLNSRVSGKSKERYTTYRCSKKNERLNGDCTNKEISAVHLKRHVVSQLMSYLNQDATVTTITRMLNDVINGDTSNRENVIKSIENRLENISVKIRNITNILAEGATSSSALLDKLNTLEQSKDDLQQQLENQKQDKPMQESIKEDEVRILLKKAKSYMESNKDELIKDVIQLFVEKIVISKDGVEIIYYLRPFSFVKSKLWRTYKERSELKEYKGFTPKILKGRWTKKAIISLSNDHPSLSKVISLVT